MAQTWMITGTSTGLGRLLTEQLLKRGDHVVATLRRNGPSSTCSLNTASAFK
ncbi:hypothetical protein [Vreelandella aquamarina]|uniref:hypothetical protein n=1 Tax=Vreelandella aquamarina TaxID=77097 RepID=UPI001CC6B743|nr:hypothetical protein [Halomonas aquamarina]